MQFLTEIYGPSLNEELLARAIARRRDGVVIATKFATIRHSSDGQGGLDGSAENVRLSVEGSLRRLGTDDIDLYYQHRMDPATPIEETGRIRPSDPRFAGDALDANLVIVERVEAVAQEIGATPAQIALAWPLAQGGDARRSRERAGLQRW